MEETTIRSRGGGAANDVRYCPPNTQQPAIGSGGEAATKSTKKEQYDRCWRMTGKVASALAKRRGGGAMMATTINMWQGCKVSSFSLRDIDKGRV